MSGWGSQRWKSEDQQRRERELRRRDERAEASREYLADIASDGPDCGDCDGD